MGMTWGRGACAGAASLALTGAVLSGAGPAQAADPVVTVVDITVTPEVDDLADGFATLVVDVALRSTEPLGDDLGPGIDDPGAVIARPVGGAQPWATGGESAPGFILWDQLSRVSGTPTDGVWRWTTDVAPIHSGSWIVSSMRDYSTSTSWDLVDVSGFGATFDLGDGAPPRRVVAASTPVRVVTGHEPWVPTARVTDRATGAGVPAPWLDYNFYAEPYGRPQVRLPAGTPMARADASGYVRYGVRPVRWNDGEYDRHVVHVYADRGTSGLSWEGETTLWPYVKWQASQRFSVSGRTVTATGNAWPAPVVYPVAERGIHLQQLVGRTWRTVGTAQVRGNGRYTITWTAPTSGPQVVRVYKPGGGTPSRGSVGTVLGFVTVTTR